MLCLVLIVLCLSRSGRCDFIFSFQAELQLFKFFFSVGWLAAAFWVTVNAGFPWSSFKDRVSSRRRLVSVSAFVLQPWSV